MRTLFRFARLLVAVPVLAAPLLPQVASACTAPACTPSRFVIGEVPASAPALPIAFDATVQNDADPRADFGVFRGDTPVPGSLVGSGNREAFVPSAPLEPGSYTVRYRNDCGNPTPETPRIEEKHFTVSAVSALPVEAGSLRVVSATRGTLSVRSSSGPCFEDLDAASVTLALDAPEALQAYDDVLAFETVVDGEPWALGNSGAPLDEALQGARGVLRLFASCEERGDGRDHGLTVGNHTVTVTPILIGGQPIAPATLQVTVACDDSNGEPGEPGDGGASSGGTDGGDLGFPPPMADGDAKQDAEDFGADDDWGSGGGCSMHTRRTGSGLALLAAAALVLARARRRFTH